MSKYKLKSKSRLLLVQCDACGMKVRTTQKWLREIGAPRCNCNRRKMRVVEPKCKTCP